MYVFQIQSEPLSPSHTAACDRARPLWTKVPSVTTDLLATKSMVPNLLSNHVDNNEVLSAIAATCL